MTTVPDAFIKDGLLFQWKLNGMQIEVSIECRSESGKIVVYRWRKERPAARRQSALSDDEIAEGIDAMRDWFAIHQRPHPEAFRDPFHPDAKKRPYRPAGFLRRLNERELATPFYGRFMRIPDEEKGGDQTVGVAPVGDGVAAASGEGDAGAKPVHAPEAAQVRPATGDAAVPGE